jgi:hypothetical protein
VGRYRADLCRDTKVMSSSCSHPSEGAKLLHQKHHQWLPLGVPGTTRSIRPPPKLRSWYAKIRGPVRNREEFDEAVGILREGHDLGPAVSTQRFLAYRPMPRS